MKVKQRRNIDKKYRIYDCTNSNKKARELARL